MGFYDDTINGAIERLEILFNNQDKDGVVEVGKELFETDTSKLIIRTTAQRFANKFPQHTNTLDYLWSSFGL